MSTEIRQYSDMAEFISAAIAPCELSDEWRSSLSGTEKFTKTASLDDAVTLSRKGWDGGLDMIDRMRAHIDKLMSGKVPVPQQQAHLSRGRVNVSRVITGNPKQFTRKVDLGLRNDARVPKILRLVYNLTVSGSIGTETIMRRGAAMVVACHTLERRGIRCSIDVVLCISNTDAPDGDKLEIRVRVKRENERVNLNNLAFMLAHPSALRRLVFAAMEHETQPIRRKFGIGRNYGGYGLPAECGEKGDIYLGRVISNADWSEALTMAWLTKILSDQGLVVSEVNPNANA